MENVPVRTIMIEPCKVKCPHKKCGHVFESLQTFSWGLDSNGHPTIENISCPKCGASTTPFDGRKKTFEFDDFKEIFYE